MPSLAIASFPCDCRVRCRAVYSAALPAIPAAPGGCDTAAGVSSGIDMALHLAAKLAGEDAAKAIQLGIEYDPEPPFDAGSPRKAPDNVVEAVRKLEDLSDLPSPTR